MNKLPLLIQGAIIINQLIRLVFPAWRIVALILFLTLFFAGSLALFRHRTTVTPLIALAAGGVFAWI